ncbi:MAG: 23S rRNA (guanosine(2251)-2'-O)-methyltransferase RlmB [Anaeromyxobacteraceae bacterium]
MRIVYGVNPVRELLQSGGEVSELWLQEGGVKAAPELERLGRELGATVRHAPRARLDKLSGSDRHQGAVAVVADFRYSELDELMAAAGEAGQPPLVVVLDGVEDPHNLGAIIRSAQALGAHGVVIPRDRAVGITPVVAKASAGAVERCKVARVTNIARSLEELKGAGIWTVALAADGERTLEQTDLVGPMAIVLGSEGEGVRPLVRRSCDFVARIPMTGGFESLNVSASAAVALYEAARQRAAANQKRPSGFPT